MMSPSRVAAAWALAVPCACGGLEPKASAPPDRGPPPPVVVTAPAPVEPKPLVGAPVLTALPEGVAPADASVRVLSPVEGAVLAPERAAGTRLQVDARAYLSQDARRRVGVVLDDERVRYLSSDGAPLTLRDLVPPDRDIAVSEHRLLAVLVDEHGRVVKKSQGPGAPAAFVRFTVGASATASGSAGPDLAVVEPQGTYNGPEAAAEARLDFFMHGASLEAPGNHRLQARFHFEGASSIAQLDRWTAYRIGGLKSGDYRIELMLLDPGGSVVAESARTITVNLDAVPPAPAKSP